MFEAARPPLPIHVTRRLLLNNTTPVSPGTDRLRIGSGYLDSGSAISAALNYQPEPSNLNLSSPEYPNVPRSQT